MKSLSSVRLLVTPWTAAYQAPLSMGFSRQEYWSGLPLPSPTPSLGLINLLEQFTKLRETLTYIYQFIKGYDKGWASQVAHWVKSLPAMQEV